MNSMNVKMGRISWKSSLLHLGLALACVAGASGCGDDETTAADPEPQKLGGSAGQWVVYEDPLEDGSPNPAEAIQGSVEIYDLGEGNTRFTLSLTGLPAGQTFGAHVHKLACDDNKAGGHYQHTPFPEGGMANDPQYANTENEVWLDITTDEAGSGSSEVTAAWTPRAEEIKAVVVHARATAEGGVAGPKLACVGLAL
jgi:superoxide dismutase, Cu-Zn family